MDEIRTEFWEAMRHLFPANAVAILLEQGDLLVTWKTNDDPVRPDKRSTPIHLRFDAALLDMMASATAKEREVLAAREADTVKKGLWGYEPDNPLQHARFIVLG
ncbi:MAG: hypothetical protein M3150_04545 [Pseudomonadota bacterium]|nr:hypothetical protein [Pseudomonadota bacterium]